MAEGVAFSGKINDTVEEVEAGAALTSFFAMGDADFETFDLDALPDGGESDEENENENDDESASGEGEEVAADEIAAPLPASNKRRSSSLVAGGGATNTAMTTGPTTRVSSGGRASKRPRATTATTNTSADKTPLYTSIAQDESPAVAAKRATTTKIFNQFLVKLNNHDSATHPYKTLEDAAAIGRAEYFTDDLLGSFVTFLMQEQQRTAKSKQGGLKYNTVVAYTSNLYQLLRDKHKLIIDEAFVKRVRSKVLRHFVQLCKDSNTQLVDGSPPMTVDDTTLLCSTLFKENTVSSYLTSLLIVMQWQLIGRIGEAACLKTVDFEFTNERGGCCISVQVTRSKTSDINKLRLFFHKSSPYVCPFFMLASYLAVSKVSMALFTHLNSSNCAGYLNGEIKRLSLALDKSGQASSLTKGLTSHSIRIGAATACSQHWHMMMFEQEETLLRWSKVVQPAYIAFNSGCISMTQIGDLSLQQSIYKLSQSNAQLEEKVSDLQIKVDFLTRQNEILLAQNRDAAKRVDLLLEKMDLLIASRTTPSNIEERAISPSSSTPTFAPVFTRRSMVVRRQQANLPPTAPLQQQQLATTTASLLPPQPLSDLISSSSMKNITCDAIFKKWFTDALCTWSLARFPVSSPSRARMLRIGRVVTYMKALLPPGTVIHPPPADKWSRGGMTGRCGSRRQLQMR
eukprot:gene26314-31787_t